MMLGHDATRSSKGQMKNFEMRNGKSLILIQLILGPLGQAGMPVLLFTYDSTEILCAAGRL
jgi:hypothetical protein